MAAEKVISREYKLVLKPANFKGDRSNLLQSAANFWTAFKNSIAEAIPINFEGELNSINEERSIQFIDTKEHLLFKQKYIFRQRQDLPDGKTELTLKFRHPDRYVSQDRDMSIPGPKSKIKFEEDIKAPFLKLYSFSSSQKLAEDTKLTKLKHVVKLYPGLEPHVDEQAAEETIEPVNTPFHEIVIGGAHITLSKNPPVDAECALIAWYKIRAFENDPAKVEFSFRYKDENGNYSRETAQNAYDLFLLVQDKMKDWIDPDGGTKTELIFGD